MNGDTRLKKASCLWYSSILALYSCACRNPGKFNSIAITRPLDVGYLKIPAGFLKVLMIIADIATPATRNETKDVALVHHPSFTLIVILPHSTPPLETVYLFPSRFRLCKPRFLHKVYAQFNITSGIINANMPIIKDNPYCPKYIDTRINVMIKTPIALPPVVE